MGFGLGVVGRVREAKWVVEERNRVSTEDLLTLAVLVREVDGLDQADSFIDVAPYRQVINLSRFWKYLGWGYRLGKVRNRLNVTERPQGFKSALKGVRGASGGDTRASCAALQILHFHIHFTKKQHLP